MPLSRIASNNRQWRTRAALLLLAVSLSGFAADSGILHVSGMLQESTCWLEVAGEEQAAPTALSQLKHQGAKADKQALTLHLQDCPYSMRHAYDPFWQQHAPSIRVAFFAPSNPADPQLIRVDGSDGVGLLLLDELHHPLPPQFSDLRVRLTAGHNILHWQTVEERTALPLRPGPWRVSGRLQVSYD